jgi:hypothetical protein
LCGLDQKQKSSVLERTHLLFRLSLPAISVMVVTGFRMRDKKGIEDKKPQDKDIGKDFLRGMAALSDLTREPNSNLAAKKSSTL